MGSQVLTRPQTFQHSSTVLLTVVHPSVFPLTQKPPNVGTWRIVALPATWIRTLLLPRFTPPQSSSNAFFLTSARWNKISIPTGPVELWASDGVVSNLRVLQQQNPVELGPCSAVKRRFSVYAFLRPNLWRS